MINIEKQYEDTITRYNYFRSVQILPTTEDLDYKGWLNNFKDGLEKNLASLILDFFMFYPKKMVDYMLIKTVGHAGYILKDKFPDWEHSHFKTRCLYTFIPGENPNPTDSGHIFVRKLRDILHIPQNQIVDFGNLHERLNKTETPIPVIFVDDFIGSGLQCFRAWNNSINASKKSLNDISMASNHIFIYTPLIASLKGYDYIKRYCSGLHLSVAHILGAEYDLFNPKCVCWKDDNDLFMQGMKLIVGKSEQLGIPDDDNKEYCMRGFYGQGLAIAFEHGAPDAIPGIFYCSENWTPLIKKVYSR
jgi:hypothetical protein